MRCSNSASVCLRGSAARASSASSASIGTGSALDEINVGREPVPGHDRSAHRRRAGRPRRRVLPRHRARPPAAGIHRRNRGGCSRSAAARSIRLGGDRLCRDDDGSHYPPRQSHAHQKFNKAMSSVGADFRRLAPVVVAAALEQARTRVCEPVDRFDLEFPERLVSAVSALLGRLGATTSGVGNRQLVDALPRARAIGAGRRTREPAARPDRRGGDPADRVRPLHAGDRVGAATRDRAPASIRAIGRSGSAPCHGDASANAAPARSSSRSVGRVLALVIVLLVTNVVTALVLVAPLPSGPAGR